MCRLLRTRLFNVVPETFCSDAARSRPPTLKSRVLHNRQSGKLIVIRLGQQSPLLTRALFRGTSNKRRAGNRRGVAPVVQTGEQTAQSALLGMSRFSGRGPAVGLGSLGWAGLAWPARRGLARSAGPAGDGWGPRLPPHSFRQRPVCCLAGLTGGGGLTGRLADRPEGQAKKVETGKWVCNFGSRAFGFVSLANHFAFPRSLFLRHAGCQERTGKGTPCHTSALAVVPGRKVSLLEHVALLVAQGLQPLGPLLAETLHVVLLVDVLALFLPRYAGLCCDAFLYSCRDTRGGPNETMGGFQNLPKTHHERCQVPPAPV